MVPLYYIVMAFNASFKSSSTGLMHFGGLRNFLGLLYIRLQVSSFVYPNFFAFVGLSWSFLPSGFSLPPPPLCNLQRGAGSLPWSAAIGGYVGCVSWGLALKSLPSLYLPEVGPLALPNHRKVSPILLPVRRCSSPLCTSFPSWGNGGVFQVRFPLFFYVSEDVVHLCRNLSQQW